MMNFTAIPRNDIPNEERHASCPCYQNNDEQTIRQILFVSGETSSLHLKAHSIIYILDGTVCVSVANLAESVTISSNEFIFLPIGTKLEFEALKSGSMLMFGLDKTIRNVPECHTFRSSRSDEHIAGDMSEIYKLQSNDRIRSFMEMVTATEQDGLKCVSFAQIMVSQLIFLIQVYYPQQMYTRFYSTILSSDVEFSDFVYQNWRKYPTATELSTALMMTPQRFTLRFRKVFGEPPGTWIRRRKTRDIYHEICSSYKSLKEIAADYDFSMPNFIRFCRTNYGRSPGAIRAQLQTESGKSAFNMIDQRSAV
jgi:AraC-like DNA-binding protein/quercetin dioxygenase-like cupin family protein